MTEAPGARLIGWAARLVPFMRRSAWRREWEAEVAHAWTRLNRDGPPSALAVLRLRLRILSCVIDALWEMKETMTMMGLLNDMRFATRSLASEEEAPSSEGRTARPARRMEDRRSGHRRTAGRGMAAGCADYAHPAAAGRLAVSSCPGLLTVRAP